MDLVETTMVNKTNLLLNPSFAGLVVTAESLNPIPFRTRPLNFPAPMVLSLKTWKSRSLPGLQRTDTLITITHSKSGPPFRRWPAFFVPDAPNDDARAGLR